MFSLAPPDVPAAPNLISFGRWCRSAIDHHRQSTNTGQCAIGTGGKFGVGGNTAARFKHTFDRPMREQTVDYGGVIVIPRKPMVLLTLTIFRSPLDRG